MITYRHHIVSLVAVFLALAVGIALGGGPLSELGRDDRPASATPRQQRAVTAEASYGDEFAAASAAALYPSVSVPWPIIIPLTPFFISPSIAFAIFR